jgi:hypothetical protein
MYECNIVKGTIDTDAVAVRQVAQCFADRCALEVLEIDFNAFNEAYFCAIVEALTSNGNVRFLELIMNVTTNTHIPMAVVNAMVALFQSPICSLSHIIFTDFTWTGHSLCHWR